MESKIIKAFFDGNLADEVITTPRTKEYTDIDDAKQLFTTNCDLC